MISLEQFKKALGPGCPAADSELENLRDQLYTLADIAVTAFLQNKSDGNEVVPTALSDEANKVSDLKKDSPTRVGNNTLR